MIFGFLLSVTLLSIRFLANKIPVVLNSAWAYHCWSDNWVIAILAYTVARFDVLPDLLLDAAG